MCLVVTSNIWLKPLGSCVVVKNVYFGFYELMQTFISKRVTDPDVVPITIDVKRWEHWKL